MLFIYISLGYVLGDTPMGRDTSEPKKPKGYPRVRASHKRLQVTWNYKGEIKYLSLGLDDTPENRYKAEDVALMIWNDLKLNRYNPENLTQYLPDYQQRNTGIKSKPTYTSLNELWVIYLDSVGEELSLNTQRVKNPPITKFLQSNTDLLITDPKSFVTRISKGLSHSSLTTKYSQVRACLSWALREELIERNYFKEYTLPRCREHAERGGDPFEVYEIQVLLEAFDTTELREWSYVVQLLLLTGCRPSEAFGLKYSDVNFSSKKITFQRRRMVVGGLTEEIEGLKTQNKRIFPMNDELITLLKSLKQLQGKKFSDHVLTVRGKPQSSHSLSRVWFGKKRGQKWDSKGVVTRLTEEGLIDHYRTPYSLRDTFITHALKAGVPITTVAKWVGNSPGVIDRHYAGALSEFSPPSLL